MKNKSSECKKEMEEGERGKRREKLEKYVVYVYWVTLLIWGAAAWISLHRIPILSSFFFFQSANFLLRLYVSTHPALVNTAVSLLHSSLCSASVVFILVKQWRSLGLGLLHHDELVHNTWPFAYYALCLSSAYFAYDQLDMLRFRLYSPSILAHHFILLLCFSLALHLRVTINYLILTLLCELHSVFLHLRKVRRMAGFRNAAAAIVKLEWLLNWFTFVFARLIPHALILIKLVKDSPKFDKGIQLPLAFFGMIAMNALNIGLGFDLFAAYNRDTRPHHHHHHHTH